MRNLILILLLSGNMLFAQERTLECIIENLPNGTVYLSKYSIKQYEVLDSVGAINGTFYFTRNNLLPNGMYRLDFRKPGRQLEGQESPFIEFIWGKESFDITGDFRQLAETVSIENSLENSVLADFRSYEQIYERKMSVIFPVIDRYPENDAFYKQAKSQFVNIQEERAGFLHKLEKKNTGLFVSELLGAYQSTKISPDLAGNDRISFLRDHFFDLVPIDNPALLHAPLYTSKIIEFLTLYREQGATYAQQEDAFIIAVDEIMANVSGDPEIRSFVIEYLLEGFESFGMEKIQTYIVDNYVDESCATIATSLAKDRVESYRSMAIGNIAPDILISSYDGERVSLSKLKSDYVLVLFWATSCEHCMEMMPKIHEWYDHDKAENIELFTISLDTVTAEWNRFNETVKPSWISTNEPRAWDGKSAVDYNIYATPTMFLLDKQRKIIAKPFTFRDLVKEVERLEIKARD